MTSGGVAYGIVPPDYRLPSATHLGAVRLQVSDLSQSLDYYQHVLGLRVIASDQTSATLGSVDGHALLYLHHEPGTHPPPDGGRLGLYHFALLVPDRGALGRLFLHLGRSGIRVLSGDHDVSESLYLWDPDGLGIEVYADRPTERWRSRGQELFMTTQRLDVHALAEAGGSEPWQGMPEGTVLGHMHLQVGDLVRSEGFYHRAMGFDKIVWSFPGALFMSAGGYHHHVGTNTWAAGAAAPESNEARLIEWEIVVPSQEDLEQIARSVHAAGYSAGRSGIGLLLHDPWGTAVRVKAHGP